MASGTHSPRDGVGAHYSTIVIWSLGNEAGPGDNFKAAYAAIKKFDTTRPIQYERNNYIVDMGSNQYPSVELTRSIASGKLKGTVYPFHISEYAHSMGNAVGDLKTNWEAVESTNFICGGAIWDWIDQSLYNYSPAGVRYLAYGGDFGDTPNDGQFVMNGLIFGNLEPKPQYYEVKRVYQPVGVKAVDMEKGKIEIFNKNYFEPLYENMSWSLLQDGKEVAKGDALIGPRKYLGPRQKAIYTIPYSLEGLDGELMVNIYFTLAQDRPWAKKGYVQMEEQLPVRKATRTLPAISAVARDAAPGQKVTISVDSKAVKEIKNFTSALTVEGAGFKAVPLATTTTG